MTKPSRAVFALSQRAREQLRDSLFPEGYAGAPSMPTYPTKKGLHLIRRALMHLDQPVPRPATCERCDRPLTECTAEYGGAELVLECRELELMKVRAQLTAALVVVKRAWDVDTRLHEVDGAGAATIYFRAALRDLNQLLPEADRV